MKTQYQIYMDFRAAKEQASKLRGIATSMETLADDSMADTLRSIQEAWTGENADKFLAKCTDEQRKIVETAGKLRNVADAIDTIAQRTYDAETAAIQLASD